MGARLCLAAYGEHGVRAIGCADTPRAPCKIQNAGRIGVANSPAQAPRIGRSPIAVRQAQELLKRDAGITVARMARFGAAFGGGHRQIARNHLRIC